MAATLTDDGQLMKADVFVSFDIEKVESTPDGDLMCFGRATDGSVDHDQQIVDPSFSSKAIRDWLESGGNIRVQHNAQRDPAGVGLEISTDGDGATWVKSLIVEPVAKKLLSAKALRAYSVGIARPTIVRDAVAKGGRITDGQIVEISLVDRPANARCGVQLVKSAGDGTPEYTGMVFGSDDDIQKALGGDLLTKGASTDTWTAPPPVDISSFQMPEDLSITFTPNDLARLVKSKFVEQHYDDLARAAAVEKRDFDRGVGGGVDRDKLPDSDFAGPHRSFPIVTQSDVSDALRLAGHADNPDAVRARIHAIARRKGFSVPDDSDSKSKGAEEAVEQVVEKADAEALAEPVAEKAADAPDEQQEATPDVTKDPKPKPVKKAKKPKKMPPWLKGDDDGDSDSKGSDDKDDDSSKSAGPVECKLDHAHTEKCHTTPAEAAGVSGSHDMDPAPVGELQESQPPVSAKGATPASASGAVGESMKPVPAHREPDGEVAEAFEADAGMSDGDSRKNAALDLAPDPELAALMRFKALGVDEDLGRLHDLTCPAYSPEMAAAYHPYATLPGLIDSGAWQRKTLAAAAGPLDQALKMAELWQGVHVLKGADQAALNDWRLELHKAFRDANPGPGSFPTPGSVSPQRYNRPVLTDGRSANAADYGSPNTAPQVATSAPNAQDFDRPPLSSAQQSPSPSFMKGGGAEYPSERGVPQRITYEQVERDKARRALSMLHDHLGHMFPSVCPMLDQDAHRQPEARPVPAPAGIGKGDGGVIPSGPGDQVSAPIAPAASTVPVAAFKATPEDVGDFFADAEVYKGFKKMRKKLGKKVLSGKMTVDEARAHLGRQFAQKGAELEPEVAKGFGPMHPIQPVPVDPAALQAEPRQWQYPVGGIDAVIAAERAAVADVVTKAVAPLLERLEQQDKERADERETFANKLAEQQRVIDAIADQPDPGTAAFSGLAFQPGVMKSRRPAAVPDQAEYAARAQDMIRRNLQSTYSTHSNPYIREKAAEALAQLGVEAAPMT